MTTSRYKKQINSAIIRPMDVYEKYCHGICDDLSLNVVLRAFSSVVDGRIGRMTFKMVTDDQMRSVLDDEDYAFWLKRKAECLSA